MQSTSHERKTKSADDLDLDLEADCANIAPSISSEYAKAQKKPKKMTQWADGGENETETTKLEIVVDGDRQDLDTVESDEVKR